MYVYCIKISSKSDRKENIYRAFITFYNTFIQYKFNFLTCTVYFLIAFQSLLW